MHPCRTQQPTLSSWRPTTGTTPIARSLSDLVRLIEHVQASLRLIERAIAARNSVRRPGKFRQRHRAGRRVAPLHESYRRPAGLRRPSWRRPPLPHGFRQHRRMRNHGAGRLAPAGLWSVGARADSRTDRLAPMTAAAAWRHGNHRRASRVTTTGRVTSGTTIDAGRRGNGSIDRAGRLHDLRPFSRRPSTTRPAASWRACPAGNECPSPCR